MRESELQKKDKSFLLFFASSPLFSLEIENLEASEALSTCKKDVPVLFRPRCDPLSPRLESLRDC